MKYIVILREDWVLAKIGDSNYLSGDNIDSLLKAMLKLPHGSKVFINNLDKKGKYLCDTANKYNIKTNTTINKDNLWFMIILNNKIKVIDANKKIPVDTEQLSNTYDIPYDGTIISEMGIWNKSLSIHYDRGMTANTISGDAMLNYKQTIGEKQFKTLFPKLSPELDKQIRRSYLGAWCYKNKDKSGKGLVLDIVSMYSYIMRNFSLPYGKPIIFEGDRIRILPKTKCQFFEIRLTGRLRRNNVPCFRSNELDNQELATEIVDETRVVTLYDLELIQQQYHIYEITFIKQYVFNGSTEMFSSYIDNHFEVKNTSKDKGEIFIAKRMLNGLYGKFGQFIDGFNTQYIDGKKITEKRGECQYVYVPLASYVTSIGRWLIINAAQQNYDIFLYSDTDSLHIEGTLSDMKNITIGTALGEFKVENEFNEAKYKSQKYYGLKLIDGSEKLVLAGVTDEEKEALDYNNFDV